MRDYAGEIVLVGINYDKRTKQHFCVIERISDKVAINTTDKEEFTTENNGGTTEKAQSTTDKILEVIRTNPRITNR